VGLLLALLLLYLGHENENSRTRVGEALTVFFLAEGGFQPLHQRLLCFIILLHLSEEKVPSMGLVRRV